MICNLLIPDVNIPKTWFMAHVIQGNSMLGQHPSKGLTHGNALKIGCCSEIMQLVSVRRVFVTLGLEKALTLFNLTFNNTMEIFRSHDYLSRKEQAPAFAETHSQEPYSPDAFWSESGTITPIHWAVDSEDSSSSSLFRNLLTT